MAVSFRSYSSTSPEATRALRGSKSSNTQCERHLRSELWRLGVRFRKNVSNLPGRPDIVIHRARIVVFCDGDFWHGRLWSKRKVKLQKGSNSSYWIAKIEGNIIRDKRDTRLLKKLGWNVIRLWESSILANTQAIAEGIAKAASVRSNLVSRAS
jgi:DNA mismatch endonuclease (patch repair protein)